MSNPSRRDLLAGSAAAAATVLLGSEPVAAEEGNKTFTIQHTNDLRSNLIGMAPASDYTPFTLNDDTTRGGFARLATLVAQRRAARAGQGPVLILDAGDYSMGTAHADKREVSEPTLSAFLKQYRNTLAEERRILFDRFEPVDAAVKVVGVGSVGTRCYGGRDFYVRSFAT